MLTEKVGCFTIIKEPLSELQKKYGPAPWRRWQNRWDRSTWRISVLCSHLFKKVFRKNHLSMKLMIIFFQTIWRSSVAASYLPKITIIIISYHYHYYLHHRLHHHHQQQQHKQRHQFVVYILLVFSPDDTFPQVLDACSLWEKARWRVFFLDHPDCQRYCHHHHAVPGGLPQF